MIRLFSQSLAVQAEAVRIESKVRKRPRPTKNMVGMTVQVTGSATREKGISRFVRYAFFKALPELRRLSSSESELAKQEFLSRLRSYQEQMALRTYSTMGTRGDVDFAVWTIADSLLKLQAFHSDIIKTGIGRFLTITHSFLAMTRPSEYFGRETDSEPSGSKYLFVYPLSKKREWYSIPVEERRRMMKDHVAVGSKYPSVTIHTSYSFGLDDHEFVLSFETDIPEDFLKLVMELRGSEASRYTAVETPIFTCISAEPQEILDLMCP